MKRKIFDFIIKNKTILIILGAYLVLTLAMTYPVVFNLNSEIPIWQSDTYQVVGQIQNQLNVFEDKGFFGGIVYLAKRHQINIFFLYSVPSFFLGKVLAYNVLFLLSFILSGFGAYLLTFYLTRNRAASFLAGLIYAFAPFHFYQSLSTHVGTMHQEWLPFFALYLFKFFENFRFKHFLAAAFFFLVIAVTEHQLLAFTAVFVALFAIYKIITRPKLLINWKFLAYSAVSIALLSAVAFFLFGPLIKVATSEENYLNAGKNQAIRYAISPADPVLPAATNSLRPDLREKMLNSLENKTLLDIDKVGEKMSSAFVSYTGIFLLLISIFSLPFRRGSSPGGSFITERKMVIFWLLVVAVFYVFSLGPSVKYDGREVIMPYNFVYENLPFYENIRTTGRFFVYALLGVSVMAGIGFAFLARKARLTKYALTGIFGLAILLEFAAAPIPTTSLVYSDFYDRVAEEEGKFKLLEIPGSTSYDYASFQAITNAEHRKPVINGMAFAREIDGQFDFQKSTPVIRHLLYNLPEGDNADDFGDSSSVIIKSNYLDSATDILNYYGIKYVTVQKKYVEAEEQANIDSFLRKYVALSDTYEDAYISAYEVSQRVPAAFYATIMDSEDKWSDKIKSKKDKLDYRRAGSGAKIKLENMSDLPKNISVTLDAKAVGGGKITFQNEEGKELSAFEISEDWQTSIFKLEAAPGTNFLVIRHFDTRGNEIKSEEKADQVAVANVVFSEE